MSARNYWYAIVAIAPTMLVGTRPAAQTATSAGRTSGAAETVSNMSGWWLTQPDPAKPVPIFEFLRFPPPLKPELKDDFRANMTRMRDGVALREYCVATPFVGYKNGQGFPDDSIEFLFTPGRVTLINAYDLVRRIHTDGRAFPSDPDETNAGTSVGHWEGATLVVETVGMRHAAGFPFPFRGAPAIGANARVNERITLVDKSTLQIETVLVAPELFTEPVKFTTRYKRDPSNVGTVVDQCVKEDRSIDEEKGRVGFDLTPPADLPPPPRKR
jgi:hypothetical protein